MTNLGPAVDALLGGLLVQLPLAQLPPLTLPRPRLPAVADAVPFMGEAVLAGVFFADFPAGLRAGFWVCSTLRWGLP
ncbi:hypothetical protein ABZ137_34445 [Streptomyces bobili]|uniref:hypothetical protein n=1 Tax=Streptomyces bobili TaxID=67280 RepID=UPI0033A45E08